MYNGISILAVIPARGGSKRLPNKNIMSLAGKPLIAWTIEAAIKSRYIDQVVVSSDSDKVLSISKKYGSDVLKRPKLISGDLSSTYDVVEHAIQNNNSKYDLVFLLQPTSPLRTSIHIDEIIEFLVRKKANAVIGVCEVEHSPQWTNTLPKNNDMSRFLDEKVINLPSQELTKYYRVNGAAYLSRVDKLMKAKSFFLKENIIAYKMSRRDSIDIDEEIDLQLAQLYLTQ